MTIESIYQVILQNLKNVQIGMLLFVISYGCNMCFSTWYNVQIKQQNFDFKRIIKSVYKIIMFEVGTTLLCIGITTIPIFCDCVGFKIPDEYKEVLENTVIIFVFITAAFRYLKEAYSKFSKILSDDFKSSDSDIEAVG